MTPSAPRVEGHQASAPLSYTTRTRPPSAAVFCSPSHIHNFKNVFLDLRWTPAPPLLPPIAPNTYWTRFSLYLLFCFVLSPPLPAWVTCGGPRYRLSLYGFYTDIDHVFLPSSVLGDLIFPSSHLFLGLLFWSPTSWETALPSLPASLWFLYSYRLLFIGIELEF